MFHVSEPQQYVSTSITSNGDAEAVNRTRFVFQTSEGDANPMFTITPVLDTVSDMRICRVCLAMSVKMYHMSQYNLSVMFEKVTGVEINAEDKLPQMLCWECVARLSSANNFVEKAFKTQWILLDKIHSSTFITASDVNSIYETHSQLKSSLSVNFLKDESNLYINEECNNEENDKQVKIKVEFVECDQINRKVDIKNETVNNIEDDDSNKTVFSINEFDLPINDEYIIKSEQIEISEEQVGINTEENDDVELENTVYYNELAIRQEVGDNKIKSCKVRKRGSRKYPMTNTLEDIDQSHNTQDTSNNLSTPSIMKNAILFVDTNNLEEPNKDHSKVAKQHRHVRPGAVDSDISFTHNASGTFRNLFICNICDKPFEERAALRQHMLRHSKLHHCSYCRFKTSNKFILNAHIESKHIKKNAYICDNCSYKTYIKKYLIAHINASHITTKPINTKHSTDDVTFDCPFCSYKTYVKNSLNVHINAKHTKNISYNCSYCSFKTYHKNYLTAHVNAKHTKDVSFSCSFCSFKTYQRQYLATHIKIKHTRSISYDCSLCKFKTYRKNYLAIHVNVKHTKHISYKCTLCSFKTYQKNYLTKHINVKHTKNISYQCSLCTFTTNQKNYLATHINAKHTRNISYDCSTCSFKAYQKSSLSRHIRTKHSKLRKR